jgi:hypothetical protein
MDAQQLYRAYRPYAVELAPKHGLALHEALLALARAAAQCPSHIEPSKAARFMHEHIEDEIVQATGQPGSAE